VTLDCTESYRECVASRKARVQAAIEAAEPGDTQDQIAEKAGVHRNTIVSAQRLLQNAQGCADCNKPVKPEKMQQSDEIERRPLMLEIIRLINGCSALEQCYLWEVIRPRYL
jgi:hypothetical protein